MPWLVGTALIHSLAVTEKRSAFKNWTVLLAIIAFSLSLLGTFLVRSGVLTSVHAFATDPARGVFILAFLGIVIGLSLLLYAWRAPTIGQGGHFELISRETFLLINNLLLVVAAGSVLLGTLYPLFLDALGLGKISVGPPYFSLVFFWIMAPLMLLLGIGPLTRWKNDQVLTLLFKLRYLLIISLLLGIIITIVFHKSIHFSLFAGIAAAAWIILTHLQNIHDKLFHKPTIWQGLRNLPRSFYGMTVAHFGVGLFVIGVIVSNTFSVEKDVRIEPNKSLDLAGYQFVLVGTKPLNGPNYKADQGQVKVLKNGKEITVLYPQKRHYLVQKMPMTEAAIDWGLTRDIYVALGEPLDEKAWSMRIYYKPFIRWIWLGGLLMVIGGLLAATDKRYRHVVTRTASKPNKLLEAVIIAR
jgi:cytochrome c-type biogenesis protein CcmF